MKKAEPQHGNVQSHPATEQESVAAATSPQSGRMAMVNTSPAIYVQRKLIDMPRNSPRQAAQRKFVEGINNSPHVIAQRKKLENLFGAAQQMEEEGDSLQRKFTTESPVQLKEPAPKSNNTGLPDNLKSGIESMSGLSMDSVKVHYNSSRPAQLNALAYAQGTDIHIAPGQEQHLPHEAWHVVQQAQGRVRPTMQMKDGVPVNDDKGLEHEADVMGARALAGGGAVEGAGVAQRGGEDGQRGKMHLNSLTSTLQLAKYDKQKKKSLLDRLRGSQRRNRLRKAKPKRMRRIYAKQRQGNYGYRNAEIQKYLTDKKISDALVRYDPSLNPGINPSYSQIGVGDVKGYYRKGWGNQPFLYLDSEAYEDKMIPSNYDDIIRNFAGHDAEAALEILQSIEGGEDVGSDKSGQAKSLIVLLTQFIEAHESRIPGSDKLARALLRRIALGQLTFKEAFNRKNGLFVSAWAKKGGAPTGGQIAGRSLFGFEREKDKYSLDDLEKYLGEDSMDKLLETVDGYYSDDSDTEEDDDLESDTSEPPEISESALNSINKALADLELGIQLDNLRQIPFLTTLGDKINKAYHKLGLLHHPDKGGDEERFNAINQARKYLHDLISQHGKYGYVDFSKRALDSLLEQQGLSAVSIRGDGNCFYASVLDQIAYLDGVNANSDTLRQLIAQLIIDNAAYFQVFVTGGQLNQIVYDILTSRSWRNIGGDFAPQLIATVLQRPVRIIQPAGPLLINPIAGLTLNVNNTFIAGHQPLTIIYDGSGHYESTRNTRRAITQ